MKNRISRNKRFWFVGNTGFTLVEILLVLLVTSVLVLGVNAAFKQAHALWSRIEKKRPLYQQTRLLVDTVRQELAGLYMPKPDEDNESAPFSLSSLPDGATKLSFFTANSSWKSSVMSDRASRICYEFASDSEPKTLSRTEQTCSGEKDISVERKEIILTGLSGLRILAADPNSGAGADSWKENLECRQKPPKAVRISLDWFSDGKEHVIFETTIPVVCQEQTTPQ
jgi:prepilin-type N-terminal cleavage/methylation domain-containing protein